MKRRATCSVERPRCAAAWRKTTRCRRRSPWCAARGRRRICSPSRPQRFRRTSGTRVSGPPITTDSAVGIIGPGRAGLGLGLALARAGYVVRLYGRRKQAIPDPLELTVGAADAPPPPAWLYHAGAVFASNYFVVVEAVAQRLLRHAGLSDAEAWQALRPLVEGTLANLLHQQPTDALTGPVVRGDDTTIRRHLASLTKDDALLYRALGRAALELAEKRGMGEATAARVADALATDLPRSEE